MTIKDRLQALEYAIRQSMPVREDQEDAAEAQHLHEAAHCGVAVDAGLSKGDLLNRVQTALRAAHTLSETQPPVAIQASDAPMRAKRSLYPEVFAQYVAGRDKQPLGDLFGLSNFGINLTTLAPGARSALRHAHSKQDEFVYILEGTPTLHTDSGKTLLAPGMCAGFKAGNGNAHCLINESTSPVRYLEIGDRTPGDSASYPDNDLQAVQVDGAWVFLHKDGSPYA